MSTTLPNPPLRTLAIAALLLWFLAPTPARSQSYDLSLSAGVSLIANQLDHGSNTLAEIMPQVPDGSVVSKYNNASGTWSQAAYSAALNAWTPAGITLRPGEGAYFQSPTNFTLTFTGTPHVPVLPVSIPDGALYLLSRQTNDIGSYDNIVGVAPTNGAMLYRWVGLDYGTNAAYTFSAGTWSPSAPSLDLGEAVWVGPHTNRLPPTPPPFQGYTVNLPNDGTYALIANQLDHGSNTLDEVMPNVPDGTTLLKWDCTIQDWSSTVYTFSAAVGGWSPNGTLAPGEGALIALGGTGPNPYPLFFTGTPHVPVLPASLPCGYDTPTLLSRQTNDLGDFKSITGLDPTEGSRMALWNQVNQSFDNYTFSSCTWSPSVPSVPVGGAALITVASPISGPPQILSGPADQTVCNGGSATFSVCVSGSPPFSYQWEQNSSPIPGATAASYTLNNASAASAGAYSVVVANAFGPATSSGANLSFTGECPPAILQQPASIAVTQGDFATLFVVASGPEPLEYIWHRNCNAGDPNYPDCLCPTCPGLASITLSNIQPSDAGDYYVVVSGSSGSATSALATLTVMPIDSYTVDIQPGFTLIANQLDHGSNTLNLVLPSAPDGSTLYKYQNGTSNGGWIVSTYSAASGLWLDGDAITLSPGEGAFLQSPSAFTLTFRGTPHVPVLPVSIPNGYAYLLSSQTADVGTYQSIVGSPPPDGAMVYQWNGTGYTVAMADSGSPTGWDDASGANPVPAPQVAVGRALWVSPSGTGTPAVTPSYGALTVITPAAGDSFCSGTTMHITWSGGNPAWNVYISLADVPSWAAYTTITPSTPNTGSYTWTIPPGVPSSTYLVYIQEVSGLSWTYGANFHIGPCPTNTCVPPPAGLGLWLPLDETSGTGSANLFAGGNPGTRMNSPTVISGYVANSLSFNGVNQFVKVLDYAAINPGASQDFSIDAWVKRATNAPNSLPSIIVDKRDPITFVGYSLALSYGNLIFQMCDGPYTNYRDTGVIPPDNQWHLVAVTVSRNQTNGGRFYIDGIQQSTFNPTAHPGSLLNTAPFQVGASPIGGNRPWLGALDEVEFFQRALQPSEVQAIYHAGSAGKCKCLPPPANMGLWLPLDETTGTTSANLAPSSNSGTHINGPAFMSGYVANSLAFNGVNQYVTVPDYPAIDPGAGQNFSIDAWVKRSANSPNSPPSIIVDKRDANTGLGYSLALSYGNLIFQLNGGGSGSFTNYRDTGTIPPDNKWHLVAVTLIRNQTTGGRFYIDGVPQSTFDPTPYAGLSLASTAAFQVAASPLGGNVPWTGGIDEVEYFQRALTAQEVLSIFNAGAAGKCKGGCGGALSLNCSTNHTVECGSQWQFTPPTAAEAGCSNISVVVLSTVTNFNGGLCSPNITRTWLATDCCGHSNTCSQTVSIVDTTPPMVTCALGFGTDCSQAWSFTPPTAVDACSGTNVFITVLSTVTNGHCPYSITRTWQVSDTCGNSTTCSQNVVVGDSTPPIISCTASKNVECGSQWDFDRPAAFDACGGATLTVSVLTTVTNGTTCAQVITRTWVATNPCGVTNTCSQTVFTHDTTPPVLACAKDKTIECSSPLTFDAPTATDACCGTNVTIAVLSTFTNSLQKCTTAITRTWSATDCCGNSNTCAQVVTISDTTPPVFSPACVTNDTLLGGNNFKTPIPASPSPGLLARLHAAGITQLKGFDDCTVNEYFAHTFTNLPHCLTSAILTVRMKPCGDICYNDSIGISFTSPSGILQSNSWGRYLGSGNPQPGLDSDNWCGHAAGQVFVFDLSALPQPSGPPLNLLGQLNALGYLDFTSQDDSGVDSLELKLVSCCYQPTKSVPCGSQWTFDPPTATDACCGTNVTVSVSSTVTNGLCPKTITRTWQATDCCNNSSFYSQAVTLIDTNPPVVYCPGPITRYVCTNSARVYFYPYAYDACSGYCAVTCNPASGSLFPLGTTIVSCTATDACGNVGFCSFPVTVSSQVLYASMLLGLPDCYKLPTEPAPKSAALLAAHPGSCWKQFDSTQVNCALGASFMGLPNSLMCGKLTVTMKPNCSDIPQNDSISVGLTTNGSGGYVNAWSSYIGGGNPGPSLTTATWCGQAGCAQTFTLNLASMPAPGGNLLPLMNSQGKLNLYIQDDTTVDYAELDYCYCRARPWWNGWEWNLVNADISVGQGFASFSPLWLVGYPTNYSVSLNPGATHGVQLGLEPLNLGTIANSSLTVSAQTTMDPDSDAIQLTGDGNGLTQFVLRRARAKTSEATVTLRLRGLPTAQTNRPPVPGTVLLSLMGTGSLIQVQSTSDGDTYSFALDDANTAVDLGGVLADEVDVTFPQTGKSPETLLAALELDMAGLSDLQLTSAAAQVNGLFPQATGQANAIAAGDQVSFDNLGSSGQDGFTLRTATPTNLLALNLTVLQNVNGTGESSGLLTGTFTGIVGPDLVDVSHFSFTQSAGGWDLTGDFAALGTTSLHTQVYNQGSLVADLSSPPGPHVPILPSSVALQVTSQGTWASYKWPQPQGIMIGGTVYTGDELRLVPVAPDLSLAGITAAAVQASGVDVLILSGATVNTLPTWVLQTPVLTPGSMTIQWTGPAGGVLNYAPSVTGPWTPVPGQSGNSALLPSPLTNGVPAQFFRVQSN